MPTRPLPTTAAARSSTAASAPHPRTRSSFHHGALREALLSAGRAELDRSGPARFSLRATVRAAGVTPNAAYHHFRNRDDLLEALVAQGFAALADRMEQAMTAAGADPAARFEATGTAYLEFASEEAALFDAMFGPRRGAGSRTGGVGSGSGLAPDSLVSRALDDALAGGLISAAGRRDAEALVWPAIHGLAVLIRAGAVADPQAAYAGMVRAVWRALS